MCQDVENESESPSLEGTGKMSFEEAGMGDQDSGVWKGLSRGRSVR